MANLTKRQLGRERCGYCGTWHEHFRLNTAGCVELKCELCDQWHPHSEVTRHHVPAGWGVSFSDPRRLSTLERRTDGASRIGDPNAVKRVRFPRTREVQACRACRDPKAKAAFDSTPRLVKKGRYNS